MTNLMLASSNGDRSAAAPYPRLSVVMPVYNAEPYLRLAIDSILVQTFRDFELIIIDDASTDKSSEIMCGYTRVDNRVRVLTNQENRGVAGTLNAGLEAASGELVAIMHADDISLPHRFQQQIDFLDRHLDHVIVGSDFSIIDSRGRLIARSFHGRALEAWELDWFAHFWTAMIHSSAMFRAGTIRGDVLRYSTKYRATEDMDFFLRVLKKGKGALLREPLVRYRMDHGSNISSRLRGEQRREARDLALSHLIVRYPDLKPYTGLIEPLFDMLAHQPFGHDRPLVEVADAMLLIESRFLRERQFSSRQKRRIHRLAGRWILLALFQAGRLRHSSEILQLLWQARTYWVSFCLEGMGFAVRRLVRVSIRVGAAWREADCR